MWWWGRRRLAQYSRVAVAALLVLNAVALTLIDQGAASEQARRPRVVETYDPEDDAVGARSPTPSTSGAGAGAVASGAAAAARAFPALDLIGANPPVYTGPVVTLRGRVIDPSGAPIANTPVHLSAHRDDLDVNRIEPVGSVCSAATRPVGCETAGRATTRADGTYSIPVFAGLDELAAIEDFEVRVPGTRERAGMIRRIDGIASVEHTVPDLLAWKPAVAVGDAQLEWAPPPVDAPISSPSDMNPIGGPDPPENSDRVRVLFSRRLPDGSTDEFYRVLGAATRAVFEPRVLEDESVSAVVEVAYGDVTWITGSVGLRGPGAPFSRHMPCTVLAPDPRSEHLLPVPVRAYADCPITDGDDATRIEGDYWMVDVDLGGTRALDLAVVRGYDQAFAVEVAEDPGEYEGEPLPGPRVTVPWVSHSGYDPAESPTKCVTTGAATTDPLIGSIATNETMMGRFVRLKLTAGNKPLSAVDRFAVWSNEPRPSN